MRLRHKNFVSEIELNKSKTAAQIEKALPISGNTEVWQEEIYFEIPVVADLENGRERVESGDVTYWPNGRCFCVFFGKSQPISAVTVIGKVKNNLDKFKEIRQGDRISLE